MPHIVAVSVARPRAHRINGHEMQSSIVRAASTSPVWFGLDGPAGNATAIHTEQVCVFCAERYDHWTDVLGISRDSWADCQFGENLMIAGLTEEDVRVGDRIRTSRGVLMEVTGPRSNCAKLTWRMGAPASFLRTLVHQGWIGYYLRMLEPGWIARGDGVDLVHRESANVSIATLTRAIHEEEAPDLHLLRTAAGSAGLGLQTSEVLRRRICEIEDRQRGGSGRWKGWRDFRIARRTAETEEVLSVTLEPVDGQAVAPHRAGQFLTVDIGAEDGASRCWSLSDYCETPEGYRLSVKRIDGGRGSTWLHGLPAGAIVRVRPPVGNFVLDRSTLRRVVLVSAGIGVTPLLAMLKAHVARGDDATPLVWLHSTRSSRTLLFREEVDRIVADHPLVTRRLHFTDPLPEDRLGIDYDARGRITPETIADLVRDPYDLTLIGRQVQVVGYNNDVYVCGPASFERSIRDAFVSRNTVPHYIRSESFGAGDALSPDAVAETAHVRVEPHGIDLTWSADEGSLLDLVLRAGIDADHGCRNGTCGACMARLAAGEIAYGPQPRVETPAGMILLCCARPSSADVTIDLPSGP